jgi:hypothetical protein
MKAINAEHMTLAATEESDPDSEIHMPSLNTPSSWEEAIADEKWKASMQEEFDTLIRMKTWELVELPLGRKAIKNKWAFKLKQNEKGEVYKLKSRLTACGYSQIENVDYDETYAAVGNRSTLRMILAITAAKDLHMHRF